VLRFIEQFLRLGLISEFLEPSFVLKFIKLIEFIKFVKLFLVLFIEFLIKQFERVTRWRRKS
jgi:hypothetical protein